MATRPFFVSLTLMAVLVLVSEVGAETCPKMCVCTKNYTDISCDRQSLSEVPKDIPKSAQILILSHNNFGNLRNNFFPPLPNLIQLHLDVSHITNVEPHAFRGLKKLKFLFLFANQIPNISEVEFCEDLPEIETIFIDRNQLTLIPNFGNCSRLVALTLENNQIHSFKFPQDYMKLVNLQRLTLSLNSVPILRKDDFQSLSNSKISRLLLSRIDLAQVENGTFTPLAHSLKALKISYNPLNTSQLGEIFLELSQCKGLLSLNLDGLKLNSRLPQGIFEPFKNIRLTSLSLSNNDIATIQSNTFSPLTRLIHLSLYGSKISSIEPTAFVGLNALQRLDLSRNRLTDIPTNLPLSLTDIIIEKNHITTIPNDILAKLSDLITLQLQKNTIQQVGEQAFGGLKKLEKLDLSSNLISHIAKKTFSPLRRLTSLNLADNKLNKIINNIHVFEQLKGLQTLDMSSNACDTLPFLVFRNLSSLQSLNLAHNRLNYMLANDLYGGTFAGLENLLTLNLQDNFIQDLSPVIFRHLISLRNLDMSKNRLTSWNKELFTYTQKIRNLDLSHNKIPVIDEYALGMNYSDFQTLNLEDNPFACTCDLVWFCRWANTTKVKLIHFTNYTCDSPKSRQGLKLINFDWRSLICFNYMPYVIAASVLLGVVILTCVLALLYRCRWRINLYCYLCGQKCCHDSDYVRLEHDLQYDAYISCAEKDVEFVQEVIMNTFDKDDNEENGKFQLYFESKAPMGMPLISSITHAVENSQRAIIVITNNYLNSDRHMYMELGHLHDEHVQRPFSLIFVTTEAFWKVGSLPKWLHNVYKKNGFLLWNEDESAKEAFRQKLERELRTPPPHRENSLLASV